MINLLPCIYCKICAKPSNWVEIAQLFWALYKKNPAWGNPGGPLRGLGALSASINHNTLRRKEMMSLCLYTLHILCQTP
jgi:hypothetical protein